MKSLKLKKLVAAAVAALTITALSPLGASAEWKQDSNGWWNTEGDSYSVGWRTIDGSWYYFDSTGYMKTGWVSDGGTWYYMQPSGSMKTGWVSDGGTWYYLQSSGAMKTGWVSDAGKWYFLAPSGAMKTGWVNDGGKWYFTAASGAMETGVIAVDGKVYYLAPDGAMATGTVTINGVTYTFAASGEAIGDKIPTPTVSFTSTGVIVTPNSTGTGTDTSQGSGGSGGGGGSSHNNSSSTPTFQQDINSKYMKYRDFTVNSDNTGDVVNFNVIFDRKVDNSTTGNDYVTQDVIVTNADGSDAGITYNNGEYTAKPGAKVYTVVRVYRDGQIGYVTSDPMIVK